MASSWPSFERYDLPKEAALRVRDALEEAAVKFGGRSCGGFGLENWTLGLKLLNSNLPTRESERCALLARGQIEMEYILELLDAMTSSARNVLDACKDRLLPIASRAGDLLSALPDDVLVLIFKFATSDSRQNTQRAVSLSQVSRRFRELALGDHSLWSNLVLAHNTNKSIVQTCMERAGEHSGFHIIINSNAGITKQQVLDFLDACTPVMSRWESILFDGESMENHMYTSFSYVMENLLRRCGAEVLLPRLRELRLFQNHYDENHREPKWTQSDSIRSSSLVRAPNLLSIYCDQYIPPRDLPFRSVTRLELFVVLLHFDLAYQLKELLHFMSSLVALDDADLELDYYERASFDIYYDRVPPFHAAHQSCHNLKSLRLCLDNNISFYTTFPNFVEYFVKSLEMPLLEDVALVVPSTPSENISDSFPFRILQSLDYNHTTQLRSLDITCEASYEGHRQILNIPLDYLLNIRTLSISTSGRILFGLGDWSTDTVTPPLPMFLENLAFESCTHMDEGCLRLIIESLQDCGTWDAVNRIEIRNCPLLQYDTVLGIVGEERLAFRSGLD